MQALLPDDLYTAVRSGMTTMHDHARRSDDEVVGLLLSDGSTVELINQARSSQRFEVSMAQLADALASIDPDQHTVYAIYHSHPGGSDSLSPLDVEAMRNSWNIDGLTLPWIVIVPNLKLTLWWLDDHYHQPEHISFYLTERPLEIAHA